MTGHQRYKQLKKDLKLTNKKVAKIVGITADSVKTVTQPNRELPGWLKFAIWVHEQPKTQLEVIYEAMEQVKNCSVPVSEQLHGEQCNNLNTACPKCYQEYLDYKNGKK